VLYVSKLRIKFERDRLIRGLMIYYNFFVSFRGCPKTT